jgi:hypothetical protein
MQGTRPRQAFFLLLLLWTLPMTFVLLLELALVVDSSLAKEWVVDSGATEHMLHIREWFTDYSPLDGKRVCQGDGSRTVQGVGKVVLQWVVPIAQRNG